MVSPHDPALVDEDERLESLRLNIEKKLWYERMVEVDAGMTTIDSHTPIQVGNIGDWLILIIDTPGSESQLTHTPLV